MLLIEIFSCTIELMTGTKSHELIFENLHKWTSSKQHKKSQHESVLCVLLGCKEKKQNFSCIVRRRRTGGGGEREKEFRSFWSFFSPLIPVCVSQQKKKSETRTQLRQQVDSSAVDSFPCVFFSRFFFFGRARRAVHETL